MTNLNFHAKKEAQQAVVNKIIQTVKQNRYSPEVKEGVVLIGSLVYNRITELRNQVSEAIDNSSFFLHYNHDSEVNIGVNVLVSENISNSEHDLNQMISGLINEFSKEQEKVVNQNNQLSFTENKNYAHLRSSIVYELNFILQGIAQGNKEITPVEAPPAAPVEAPVEAPPTAPVEAPPAAPVVPIVNEVKAPVKKAPVKKTDKKK